MAGLWRGAAILGSGGAARSHLLDARAVEEWCREVQRSASADQEHDLNEPRERDRTADSGD